MTLLTLENKIEDEVHKVHRYLMTFINTIDKILNEHPNMLHIVLEKMLEECDDEMHYNIIRSIIIIILEIENNKKIINEAVDIALLYYTERYSYIHNDDKYERMKYYANKLKNDISNY